MAISSPAREPSSTSSLTRASDSASIGTRGSEVPPVPAMVRAASALVLKTVAFSVSDSCQSGFQS
ncbi:hypothetical protein D3C87_2036530 [compost metagenome]